MTTNSVEVSKQIKSVIINNRHLLLTPGDQYILLNSIAKEIFHLPQDHENLLNCIAILIKEVKDEFDKEVLSFNC